MKIYLHQKDLPKGLDLGPVVAVDTETMGLNPLRDRLCLVQLSSGNGECHLVQIPLSHDPEDSPNLRRLLENQEVEKIFHYARFDVAALFVHLRVLTVPIFCTKIASRLVRTYTDRHGLRDLCRELLGVEISKQEQTSYWGAPQLTEDQLHYAATDVLHLHKLKKILEERLITENREELAYDLFGFLPTRAYMDVIFGGESFDPFTHSV